MAEIRHGIDPQNLDNSVPVNLTPKQAILGSGTDRGFVWHAALPVDSQSVFCQFVFRDGTETEPLQVPIEDL